MEINVWMDHWQMECCGIPFEVGSEVRWQLRPPTGLEWLDVAFPPGFAATVDAVEDHHGGNPLTRATVVSIAAVHCRFEPEELVAGSGRMTAAREALRWNEDTNDRQFAGFLTRVLVAERA